MPERDHHISLSDAVALVRAHKPTGDVPHAWMVSRGIIDEILAQPGCAGIRFYMGGTGAATTIVAVGTDASDDDIAQGVLAEQLKPCPPFCSIGSPFAQ